MINHINVSVKERPLFLHFLLSLLTASAQLLLRMFLLLLRVSKLLLLIISFGHNSVVTKLTRPVGNNLRGKATL